MKRIWNLTRTYRWLAIALAASIVALGVDLPGWHRQAHWLIIAVVGIELIPLLAHMIEDIRHGTYGVDILAITAILASVVLGQYWAGMVLVIMITGGQALENYAQRQAKKELSSLLSRAPQQARILRGKQEIEVRASQVHEGDKIIIRPGEVTPVDARILEGTASFDESSLTGESLPQVKTIGEDILSGSINQDGVIVAQALHSAANSQYEQIIKLVQAASKSQAPFVRLADKYAIPFSLIAFGIAGVAWALSRQPIRFLEVMVVATPCPLILAAPIAIIAGMGQAARRGIIIKSGAALEKLATISSVAFDKTGTLTKGQPEVATVRVFDSYKENEVLSLAAALERNSNHVLAEAIIDKAASLQLPIAKAKHVREISGHGLSGAIGSKKVLLGRLSMLREQGVAIPKQFSLSSVQSTATYVAINGELAGVITFTDELRPDAQTTIRQLLKSGVKQVIMVTGDSRQTAERIAKKLGIKQYYAESLPGDKILAVEKLHDRPVAFVGDGVNDAPVLMASDLGIALGARGSTAASESADIVIMTDDLHNVVVGRTIAKRTFFIAQQSILVGIALSIGLMAIFATGKFKPIYGAIIQELVDVVVIFNALRAHNAKRR